MTADERFDRIDGSIGELTRNVADLTRSVAVLSRDLDRLTNYVLDFRTEVATRFQLLETRLEVLAATTAGLQSTYPALTKAINDFGAVATRLGNEQSRQREAGADLSTRVTKLEEIVSRLIEPAA
jgi:hypothetical protein